MKGNTKHLNHCNQDKTMQRMFIFKNQTLRLGIIFLALISLVACGGARVSKKWEQTQHDRPTLDLAVQTDVLEANLDWIVVRNGPGSWAKDAFWDEYILTINNSSEAWLAIENIVVIDSTQTVVNTEYSRKALKKAYKVVKKRSKKAGLKIKLGEGSTEATGNSIVAAAVVAGGAGSGSVAVAGGGTLTAAGGAIVVAVPAIAIGTVMKMVNNKKVNEKIVEKKTVFPIQLSAQETLQLNVIFPAIPSPSLVRITYTSDTGGHTADILSLIHI